ncbi:hypothetical protein BSCG_03116 [Bacteroides sp. 2_2_4]|uniref:Uncharacterized protein n=1 Tax=Bacteroides ovatus (strain ATCC 8483 / DSM 1896 / JCM 5824 / BCRC 10623 / CCUG 4943 / NCTC 11153) TaxID=411476 RepID=A0AAN3ACQ4_BACO1|nr:hypothetical protein BACOVA_00142 [Bacteroides ovatus ATCC 8483]EEO56190.1 hypothetical protein BSCG_03116 [Bacteroides sp. 2_2_4]
MIEWQRASSFHLSPYFLLFPLQELYGRFIGHICPTC